MLCMYMQITLMSMNCRLLGFLYAFIISSYHVFASPSYARLPGALTLKLTSLQRYHVVNGLQDDLPLCGSPPSTTTLPPPTPASGSPTVGSYIPSPPVPSSSSYPTPPASPSSSYPSYPTPPSCYATPYTPPISTNPGSPASYQPSNGLSPPYSYEPSPPYSYEPSPPYSYEPSPPYSYEPSPPTFSFPSPTAFIPAPPLFEPPVVYPPPNGPSPPHSESESALWCVAKPSVPDPIIQEAMSYACGSGANCESLQPNGECFLPDTLFAHASYAFNSYWQRTKVAGATCSFGGSAMLVTVDPSYDGCHFIYF